LNTLTVDLYIPYVQQEYTEPPVLAHTSKTLKKTCIPPSSTNTSQVNGASSTQT